MESNAPGAMDQARVGTEKFYRHITMLFGSSEQEPPAETESGDGDHDETKEEVCRRMTGTGMFSSHAEANQRAEASEASQDNKKVEIFIGGMIVLNAFSMGLSIQLQHGAWPGVWAVFEHVFTAVFFLEMVLKIYQLRGAYFFSGWNLLDCFLAMLAVMDNWVLAFVVDNSQMQRLTILRMIRLARLARILKVVKLNKEVVVLVEGIIASLKAMVPIGFLLAISIYAFSIGCVDTVGAQDWGEDFDNEAYFGSLSNAWLTLFSMCILAEWGEIIRPMYIAQTMYVPFFMAFAFVNAFGIMNVIIGVIVENTADAASRLKEEAAELKLHEQMQQVFHIADLLEIFDKDHDGKVTLEEFNNSKELEEIAGFLNLPHGFTARELHLMLDDDGSGSLTVSEFVTGMFRLIHCEPFQNICLNRLQFNGLKSTLSDIKVQIDSSRHALEEQIQGVKADLAEFAQSSLKPNMIPKTGPPGAVEQEKGLLDGLEVGPGIAISITEFGSHQWEQALAESAQVPISFMEPSPQSYAVLRSESTDHSEGCAQALPNSSVMAPHAHDLLPYSAGTWSPTIVSVASIGNVSSRSPLQTIDFAGSTAAVCPKSVDVTLRSNEHTTSEESL